MRVESFFRAKNLKEHCHSRISLEKSQHCGCGLSAAYFLQREVRHINANFAEYHCRLAWHFYAESQLSIAAVFLPA